MPRVAAGLRYSLLALATLSATLSATLGCPAVPQALRPASARTLNTGAANTAGAGDAADGGRQVDADSGAQMAMDADVVVPADAALIAEIVDDGSVDEPRRLALARGGEEARLRGDAAGAVALLRQSVRATGTPEAWASLGRAYADLGARERAIRCLEQALVDDAAATQTRVALARVALDAKDTPRAARHVLELVRQAPLDPAVRQLEGRAALQAQRWRAAISAFELVVAAQPDNVYAHNNLGFAALQVGDLTSAREHMEQAVAAGAKEGFVFNNLGVVYERLGRVAEAYAAFARAAELAPRYASAALNRDRLQRNLTQEDRLTSADILLSMRAHGTTLLAPSVADVLGAGAAGQRTANAGPGGV